MRHAITVYYPYYVSGSVPSSLLASALVELGFKHRESEERIDGTKTTMARSSPRRNHTLYTISWVSRMGADPLEKRIVRVFNDHASRLTTSPLNPVINSYSLPPIQLPLALWPNISVWRVCASPEGDKYLNGAGTRDLNNVASLFTWICHRLRTHIYVSREKEHYRIDRLYDPMTLRPVLYLTYLREGLPHVKVSDDLLPFYDQVLTDPVRSLYTHIPKDVFADMLEETGHLELAVNAMETNSANVAWPLQELSK
jgi:hypothetical protein